MTTGVGFANKLVVKEFWITVQSLLNLDVKISNRRACRGQAAATAISEGLPPGPAVSGLTAFRETPGKGLAAQRAGIKIGDVEREEPVQADDQGVSFDLSLEAGEVDFLAYFILKEGKKVGAYYADVEKL
ncbi:MAG: hypothetical protein IIA65_05700 [Planctomycetes bacterium]|nr:hypothetical protein [Planctomycetota bacterium]